MLLTPHVLVGAAIAAKTANPALGLVFAFLSHYFLDCFPQWEYSIENIKEKRWSKSLPEFLRIFLDFSLGILIILFLLGNNYLILAAALLAMVPDGFTFLSIIFSNNKLLEKHQIFHCKINSFFADKKISPFWGVFSEVLVIAVAIFFFAP